MFFEVIGGVLVIIGGLAGILWVANWPFNTPWEDELTDEQRRIELAHNRRHHRAVARLLSPALAIIFGIASVYLFAGPKSDWPSAVGMGACSAVCVGVFVVLIKMGRGRGSSTRR